jgi:Cu(I)/Ag(I) efflux system membrane fusion protein
MRLIASLAVLASLSVYAAEERDYQWTQVEVAELNSGLKVTGRMIPQDGALNIESARVAGRVLSILKREGERVWPGSPLFAVSSAECFSLLEEKKVASSQGMKELIDGVSKREKQLALSVNADSCKVVSSHSGVLTKRNVESGAAFNPGDPLVTVLDVNRLTAEFDLPERDMAKVKLDQRVRFHLASDPGAAYDTKISNIVPMIDAQSRTTKVRVAPVKIKTATTQDALIFGEIETGSRESIYKVPSAALVFSHDKQFVIKGPKERPAAVEVQVIGESDNFSSIRPVRMKELSEADIVASRGAIFLLKQVGVPGPKL